jgi:hypothetical protein
MPADPEGRMLQSPERQSRWAAWRLHRMPEGRQKGVQAASHFCGCAQQALLALWSGQARCRFRHCAAKCGWPEA